MFNIKNLLFITTLKILCEWQWLMKMDSDLA